MKKLYAIILFVFIGTIANAQYTKILDFAGTANGQNPQSDLIADGTFLYGMAKNGGTNNLGVLFKIKPDGSGYANLLDFAGTINGSYPRGFLISDGTFLYGMTEQGGTSGYGTIFKIKPDGSGYSKLLDFLGTNGSYPTGSLISDGTFLYGMTYSGGTNSIGIIFKIKPDGTGFVKLLDFAGTTNGSNPRGSLISDGTFLYGMTTQGGTSGYGVVFKIMSDGSGYSKLLDFSGTANGSTPYGSLISDGTFLYGMTADGGINGWGVVFKIKPDGSGYADLHDFASGANGKNPRGSLISDGTFLYGMTNTGGTNNMGVFFKIKPDGTAYSKLLDFSSTNGSIPYGSLIFDGNFLYGMAETGGTNNMGTVFKYQPSGVGVIENTVETDFMIFPNPSNGIFTIESSEKISAVEIMNVLGEKVSELMSSGVNELNSTTQPLNHSTTLNLSSKPSGVCFLQIKTETGNAVKKIVIQK